MSQLNSLITHNAKLREILSLIKSGCNVNEPDEQNTLPLISAIEMKDNTKKQIQKKLALTQLLLKAGANVRKETTEYPSPLNYCISGASGFKCLSQLKLLFDSAGELSKDELLIYKLCFSNTWEEIQPYFYDKACATKRFLNGMTLFMIAIVWDKSTDILQKLLDYGSNINATDNMGWSALHYNYQNYETVKFLLEHGADINAIDQDGDSDILEFVFTLKDREKYITLILQHHPTVNTLEKIWKSLINWEYNKLKQKDIMTLKILLEAGVNPNIFEGSNTLLHQLAKYTKRRDLMKLLIDYGADVNIQTEQLDGTPLILAATENRDLENIKFLIRHGANPFIKDACGKDFFGHYDWSIHTPNDKHTSKIHQMTEELRTYAEKHLT